MKKEMVKTQIYNHLKQNTMLHTRKQLAGFIANQFNREGFAEYLASRLNERQLIREFERASGRQVQRFATDKYYLL
jgi:hypothetical protein